MLITGIEYTAVVSDEPEALLAAKAAGSAVIGLWQPDSKADLTMARYLIERPEDLDRSYLEQVIRRTYGLPWQIAVTKRLVIRELQLSDLDRLPAEPEDSAGEQILKNRETLAAYIEHQYGFYGFGQWVLEEKNTGRLIGLAGVDMIRDEEDPELSGDDSLELGYHVFAPYRRQGYAFEACRAILPYAGETLGIRTFLIRTEAVNEASCRLAEKLNFIQCRKDNQQRPGLYHLSWCCSE